MLPLIFSLVVTTSSIATHPPPFLLDADLQDLTMLPLDKLVAIRRALNHKETFPSKNGENGSSTVHGQAQALRGDPGWGTTPPRRGGPSIWVEEVDEWKGSGGGGGMGGKGKGGLQKIFQGTVTVLAFLAFGGYLVALVLNALKQKSAALEMTLLTTVAPATRRRRAARLQVDSRDRMFAALQALAEGYAKYNYRCLHG